ncbi:unnamed protein product [Lactuca saligna]|uniref:AB hydrolase-1 domain-containing protein n=1 Tax=Lactuca saligna TaxID=75948 RepID=A0AA35VKE9_LACSI|nr:unnamed protein product [Lactuca saligna]
MVDKYGKKQGRSWLLNLNKSNTSLDSLGSAVSSQSVNGGILAIQVKMNILRFSGFVWQESDEKQKLKVKEKLDKYNKEKFLEFCDLFDMPIGKTSAKKEDVVIKLIDFMLKPHVTNKTEDWFIDSREEWRKVNHLDKFIFLGHSLGGYVVSKYALKHPEHVHHLVLVGPAGFTLEVDHKSEWLTKSRTTWKGAVMMHLWESNFTPMKVLSLDVWNFMMELMIHKVTALAIHKPMSAMMHHAGHRFHEVFQMKHGDYSDLPATKISELMICNSLDVISLMLVVPCELINIHILHLYNFRIFYCTYCPYIVASKHSNGILDESISSMSSEIPHVCMLLQKSFFFL